MRSDDIADRLVCLDDTCVGIIGPHNRCGVCGRPGPPREGGPMRAAPLVETAVHEPVYAADDAWAATEVDPADRILCPDETCVGIIGPRGRCGICGREQAPPEEEKEVKTAIGAARAKQLRKEML